MRVFIPNSTKIENEEKKIHEGKLNKQVSILCHKGKKIKKV